MLSLHGSGDGVSEFVDYLTQEHCDDYHWEVAEGYSYTWDLWAR